MGCLNVLSPALVGQILIKHVKLSEPQIYMWLHSLDCYSFCEALRLQCEGCGFVQEVLRHFLFAVPIGVNL